mgnify:CR=1 FL=1
MKTLSRFKKMGMAATLVAGFVFALPTWARRSSPEVIRIELGEDESSEGEITKRELERRIYRLERAVRQLQDRIFELETKEPSAEKDITYTCLIETSFHGTVSAEDKSETKARAAVLKKCMTETKESLKCKGEFVKCGE